MPDLGLMSPTDNLVRSRYDDDAVELRTDVDEDGTLFGHFAVFDTWTTIDSRREGRFLERVAPIAFDEAFTDTRGVRVLFEHGADPSIGNKPIASPDVLRADDVGAYYEAPLFTEASYVNDLMPALRAGQLGASFRFSVKEQERVTPRRATAHNPDRLVERTILNVQLYEFGPVTWGAYPTATAGVRSATDEFYERLLTDPLFLARYVDRVGMAVAERTLAAASDDVDADALPPEVTADGLRTGSTKTQRRAKKALRDIA